MAGSPGHAAGDAEMESGRAGFGKQGLELVVEKVVIVLSEQVVQILAGKLAEVRCRDGRGSPQHGGVDRGGILDDFVGRIAQTWYGMP